jgi:alkyl hydroperoxide reductase 1
MFRWAPITDDDPTVCGRPQEYDASKEWKEKKVVLFSVPGKSPIMSTHDFC